LDGTAEGGESAAECGVRLENVALTRETMREKQQRHNLNTHTGTRTRANATRAQAPTSNGARDARGRGGEGRGGGRWGTTLEDAGKTQHANTHMPSSQQSDERERCGAPGSRERERERDNIGATQSAEGRGAL
jgi:hypothetical protein